MLRSLSFVGLLAMAGCSCVEEVPDPVGLVHPEASPESNALSTPDPREGNSLRLLINGEASFAERVRLLKSAQESIYIQALIWKADTAGRALADALIERKRENPELDIRVIVDAYSNIQDTDAQLMYFELKNAGVDIEGFEAFYLHWLNEVDLGDWLSSNKRYHEKYWVIDGREAVVGGMNIADEYARCTAEPELIWRDQDVWLSGPVVADIQAAFLDNFATFKQVKQDKPDLLNSDAYWKQWTKLHPRLADGFVDTTLAIKDGTNALIEGREAAAPCSGTAVATEQYDDVTVRFIRNRPREGDRHIHQLYLQRIAAAKERVLILNAYFVPTDDLMAALIAAAQRGVEVTVVNNSDKTNDIPIITAAGRLRYAELIEGGVKVYEWDAQAHGEGTLHAKFAVFDHTHTIIGSYNLDPRSIGLNSEDVVAIAHEPTARELAGWVMEHDLPLARAISLEEAREWGKPGALPQHESNLLTWTDPNFDPGMFEYLLIRGIEDHL